MNAFFTAVTALAALGSAWLAFTAIKDKRAFGLRAERSEDYRRILAHPVVDELQRFVREMRQLFADERSRAANADPTLMENLLAEQKRLSKAYRQQYIKLFDALMDAARTWGDPVLSGRMEYQLDKLDELAEQFEAVVHPKRPDPRIADQVSAISATISRIVMRHDYMSDPVSDASQRRVRGMGGSHV